MGDGEGDAEGEGVEDMQANGNYFGFIDETGAVKNCLHTYIFLMDTLLSTHLYHYIPWYTLIYSK